MPLTNKVGRQLHATYVTKGIQNPFLWRNLINSYLSHGFVREALTVYTQNLPSRTHQPILPLILKACAFLSLVSFGQSLHGESMKVGLSDELLVGTTLVSMYCKCGNLVDARRVFDGMPEKNVVTYNAMIGGYSMNGDMVSASVLFDRLSVRTWTTWAGMIEGFSRTGNVGEARRLFDRTLPKLRSVLIWTVMVHGYAINGMMDAARELFELMPCRNVFVWSSMISGYFKKCNAEEARVIFDRVPIRNLVIWNALIAGYTQIGSCEEALEAFRRMQVDGFEPDEFTVASVLSACSQLGSLESGKEIHDLILHKRIKMNHHVSNGLVDMYAKCGDIGRARRIFDGMSKRNVVCWNSMISGLASHGHCDEALDLFAQMEVAGEKPDSVTFLGVLSACTHGGIVEKGLEIFTNMERYGVVAGVEHYGCVVDLLGRAGKLAEAYDFIKKMPMKPNETVWGALLGTCRMHTDREMADRVVDEVSTSNLSAGTGEDAQFVTLSNIYAASEEWEMAERIRRAMADNSIQKTAGSSSVLVEQQRFQTNFSDSQAY